MPDAKRTAPVQGHAPIPWAVHEAAWHVYAKRYGTYQSADRIAERGGFGVEEMDEYHPTWREESEEIPGLRKRIAELAETLRNVFESIGGMADDNGLVHASFSRDEVEAIEAALAKAEGGSDER